MSIPSPRLILVKSGSHYKPYVSLKPTLASSAPLPPLWLFQPPRLFKKALPQKYSSHHLIFHHALQTILIILTTERMSQPLAPPSSLLLVKILQKLCKVVFWGNKKAEPAPDQPCLYT
jgi:hypothetical protein